MKENQSTNNCVLCGTPEGEYSHTEGVCRACLGEMFTIVSLARSKAVKAIKDGLLTRKPCEVCGESNAQAHHDDYTKPLDIRWLCRSHHMKIHQNQVVMVEVALARQLAANGLRDRYDVFDYKRGRKS